MAAAKLPGNRRRATAGWGTLTALLAPSAPLLLLLLLYARFDGTGHFVLHTLTGWAVALILSLLGTDSATLAR